MDRFGPTGKVSKKTGPPFEVVLFSRSDRLEFWLNGSRTGKSSLNATFVHFLGALLLAPEEQERHDVTNMTTLNEIHQTGKGESA